MILWGDARHFYIDSLLMKKHSTTIMDTEIDWLLREKHSNEKSEAFFADVARLDVGEPLAYIIGHVPFLNCTIYLDSKPLIPRPETEFWVEKAIEVIAPACSVLDLCAGSGAIGVAVTKSLPHCHVTFGELESTHISTIKKNLNLNTTIYRSVLGDNSEISLSDIFPPHQVILSDLFENIPGRFDYIFCNPPYIDQKANTVEQSVKNFEPHLALFGGEAGMELITEIIAESRSHLTPTGQLWLEHEPSQVEAIASLAKRYNFFCITHLDQYKTPRYSVLSMAQ